MRTSKSYKAGFLTGLLSLVLALPISAQYTLTDDDVVVIDGMIESCTYDFAITDIIIPEILDGQTIVGIASKPYYAGVFQ